MRSAAIRTKVQQLIRGVPFRPFVLSLENGQSVTIAHPENIAFEPGDNGSEDFYVLTTGLQIQSTFSAVTSVLLLDEHASVSAEK
jgi:hypothetical protein